ncbi:MAG: sigma-54-dependent Fis family transcriptional regulator [Phycisphaerales bacterium]|nr:sigma-54-dependent Fis family transcriptional regulator [Phycisphaerales bacterium]MCB9854358.1 sigma-54-dependent Fis family transcriptional regulator [Phycisphaerales bacterium]MCB9863559.1 sigma-54-dependent Fis family transcriptional regulator [Phycisphaerales bacterium]
MNKPRILIIEDEKLIRWSLRQRFEEEGHFVDEAETGPLGLEKIESTVFDLVMLDNKLPGMSGLDVLRAVRAVDEDIVILMMTAYSNVEDAVEAMRLGAFDYVSKPFKMDALMLTVGKALETTRLKREVRDFRAQMKRQFGFDRILGQCASMKQLFDMIRDVAESGASTIFLRGESGTGKDLVAKAIHYNSDRANRPFMNITCTALSESLLESELFGHERGAFTDARQQKKGLFELADHGTVFLDEVGDMPPKLQAKLLRFLEEKTFRRVGGVKDIQVDVRIVAATNRDIEAFVAAGDFREDLYYRLNIIPISLPPLRERGDDIRIIAEFYVDQYATEFRRGPRHISEEAQRKLMSHYWPGNVRELRNTIERAVLFCKNDTIDADDLVIGARAPTNAALSTHIPPEGVSIQDIEESLVRRALEQTDNNQTKAAKLLHLSRDQLRYRMERYGLL